MQLIARTRTHTTGRPIAAGWLRFVIASSAAGVVVTVISAWVVKLVVEEFGHTLWARSHPEHPSWQYAAPSKPLNLIGTQAAPATLGERSYGYVWQYGVVETRHLPVIRPSAHSVLRCRPELPGDYHVAAVCSDVVGWPWRSMRSEVRLSAGDERIELQTAWGIRLTGDGGLGPRDYIALPLRPLWPGFVLNTLVFGALAGCGHHAQPRTPFRPLSPTRETRAVHLVQL